MGPNYHAVYDVQAENEFNSQASIMFSMRYVLILFLNLCETAAR